MHTVSKFLVYSGLMTSVISYSFLSTPVVVLANENASTTNVVFAPKDISPVSNHTVSSAKTKQPLEGSPEETKALEEMLGVTSYVVQKNKSTKIEIENIIKNEIITSPNNKQHRVDIEGLSSKYLYSKNVVKNIGEKKERVITSTDDSIFITESNPEEEKTTDKKIDIKEDAYLFGDYFVILQNLDTNLIGKQKVTIKFRLLSPIELKTLEVTKSSDSIKFEDVTNNEAIITSKNIIIDIIDNTAPTIQLSKKSDTIQVGDDFNIKKYIKKITDDTDKNLDYKVEGKVNTNKAGIYNLTIKATDTSGNTSSVRFKLTVKKQPKPENLYENTYKSSHNISYHNSNSSIVDTAYAYSSSPYVWGGTTPSGFDCSGFVQYVYAQNGISIPRTADAQGQAGYGVSSGDMQPGDIIIYGYGNHVGIYAGNGKVIHALNPSVGITVGQWDYPYNGEVTAIRRI